MEYFLYICAMEEMTINLTDGQVVKFTHIEPMGMVTIELGDGSSQSSRAYVTMDEAVWVQNALNYYIKSIKENGNQR